MKTGRVWRKKKKQKAKIRKTSSRSLCLDVSFFSSSSFSIIAVFFLGNIVDELNVNEQVSSLVLIFSFRHVQMIIVDRRLFLTGIDSHHCEYRAVHRWSMINSRVRVSYLSLIIIRSMLKHREKYKARGENFSCRYLSVVFSEKLFRSTRSTSIDETRQVLNEWTQRLEIRV